MRASINNLHCQNLDVQLVVECQAVTKRSCMVLPPASLLRKKENGAQLQLATHHRYLLSTIA